MRVKSEVKIIKTISAVFFYVAEIIKALSDDF